MPRKPKPETETATDTIDRPKPQRLGKAQVMGLWHSLPDDSPIAVSPIPSKHKGSSYAQDTIRVTGSQEFINSVMANMKGFLDFDGNGARLDVNYVQTQNRETGELTGSWAFYLKVSASSNQRGRKRRDASVEVDGTETNHKAVNAGLAIRDSLRAAAKEKAPDLTPASAKPKKSSRDEPLYAIGRVDEDEGYLWAEPIEDGTGWPMETYEDVASCDTALMMLGKTFQKAGYMAIPVYMKGKKIEVLS